MYNKTTVIKLIIAGSRTFSDYNLLKLEVMKFAVESVFDESPVIISGTARGADALGERFAEQYNLQIERYPADWNLHGKAAGHIRNEEMAKVATHCIVFWDGKSSGTKSMIDLASKYKLKLKVINYENA